MQTDQLVPLSASGAQGASTGAPASSGVSLEKQYQKAVKTRVLDHVGPYLRLVQARSSAASVRQVSHLQPTFACSLDLLSPLAYPQTPASSIGTKFVTSSFFRHRAAINHLVYTPDGRRLLCAGNNGNVSLWNGTNFENELGPGIQAHEASPIRCMVFSHSGLFLLSCDDMGRVKFSKPTLEVLQVYPAHKEPCRSVSFSPTDFKFVTGSDDSTVRVFDTFRGQELSMTGHGGDVRWVDWHPTKGVIASCSKDACIKLWDPRVGSCLSTLHGHKNGIFQVKWNLNGHWLLSCSRDQLAKLYDVRMLREMATFTGHGRDVTCVSWHPQHEELFVSGAVDGSLMMWLASRPDAQGVIPAAHDASVWTTAWHPLGHVLASAGADQKCQFWCRKRPGDIWQDVFGHEFAGTAAGGSAAAAAAAAAGGDSVAAAQAGGFTAPAAAAAAGGGGGGAASVAVPGLGVGGGPPGLGLGSTAASGRSNVIPGIGAVLDQLATANLQSLMGFTAPAAPGGAAAGAPAAGAGGRSGGGAGAKRFREDRFREDGPRGPSMRGGDRERERERDGRGERWGDRERDGGPGKVARLDGPGPPRGGEGAGRGPGPRHGPGRGWGHEGGPGGGPGGGPPPGFGGHGPPGLSGPGGPGMGPGTLHDMRRGATGAGPHYAPPYEGGYEQGGGRLGAPGAGDMSGPGSMQQGRLPPPGERMERRQPPHGGAPPPRFPGPGAQGAGGPPYDPYTHELRGYDRGGRAGGPGPGRPYGGYPMPHGDAGGGGAPQPRGYEGYGHGPGGPGPDEPYGGGPGPGGGRGPPPHHRGRGGGPGGGPPSMHGPGRGRGRGRSSGW
ncbi:hypothetical protein PLESTB_000402900 [Pleodorina starrii]|uniref:Uncharacterized protein n=1 Tax=Pleodorina starrii TaxID=330485 RepID=A0A9W6BFI8_9CHLO|nr:hypothetical protein PLESTB_000402900 [Pleodorina starrii]